MSIPPLVLVLVTPLVIVPVDIVDPPVVANVTVIGWFIGNPEPVTRSGNAVFHETTPETGEIVIEDTVEYVTAINADGATMKNWKHTTSTPELIGFTITSKEIWEEYKPKMTMN